MRRGLTAIEVLVAVVALLVLAGILVPFLSVRTRHGTPPIFRESVNLRNIHMGMAAYSASNKDYYPGLTATGGYIGKPFQGEYYGAMPNAANAAEEITGDGCTVSTGTNIAMAILLEDAQVAPAQLIAPGETNETSGSTPKVLLPAVPDGVAGTKVAPTGPGTPAVVGEFRDENFSFSALAYGKPILKTEWKANANPKACVFATRLIFHAKTGDFNSLWTNTESGKWKGSVVYGDASTNIEVFNSGDLATPANPFTSLRYGPASPTNPAFTPSTESTSVVGIFGRSADMKNFDASATTGQLGSAND